MDAVLVTRTNRVEVLHKHGKAIELVRFGVNHYTRDGKPARLIEFLSDITERREATRQLIDAKQALERVATNTPVVIYDYVLHPDGHGQFLYISPRCREMFELEPEALIAEMDRFWALVLP